MTNNGISTNAERHNTSLIVKVGSNVLLHNDGIDGRVIAHLAKQIKDVRRQACVTLVTSGAAGAGEYSMRSLRNGHMPSGTDPALKKKLDAGIGQPLIMHAYRAAFGCDTPTAQVLITEADLQAPQDTTSLIHILDGYHAMGVLPIINGNDPACSADLMPLDNDDLVCRIAYLMGTLVRIILTDTDGVLDQNGDVIKTIHCDSTEWETSIREEKSSNGTGGMKPKIQTGIALVKKDHRPLHIANGKRNDIIRRIMNGEKEPGNAWTTIVP